MTDTNASNHIVMHGMYLSHWVYTVLIKYQEYIITIVIAIDVDDFSWCKMFAWWSTSSTLSQNSLHWVITCTLQGSHVEPAFMNTYSRSGLETLSSHNVTFVCKQHKHVIDCFWINDIHGYFLEYYLYIVQSQYAHLVK